MSQLGYDDVLRMLKGAAAEVRANHETLSKLDSVGGDGDHGTTMLRCMDAVEGAIEQNAGGLESLLSQAGWAVMGIDGGATGPLFGSLFMGMADGAGKAETIGASELAEMLKHGLAKVCKRTKAQPGDKTMLDALIPAVQAVDTAAAAGAPVLEALTAGATAAQQGAAATSAMQAKFGRAKNIKEKSIGSEDPGAASVACIFKGFLEGAKHNA